jgi:hypothetical protein
LEFNLKFISPRRDEVNYAGLGRLSGPGTTSNPFRRQLRWLMRVTFFDCKKSNQKCALQAAAVRGAARIGPGFGVWHRALISLLLVRVERSPRLAGDEWIPASMIVGAGS